MPSCSGSMAEDSLQELTYSIQDTSWLQGMSWLSSLTTGSISLVREVMIISY